MRRASPGRAVRIVISSMPRHCARFCGGWGVGCRALDRRLAISGGRRYVAPMSNIRRCLVGALAVSATALAALSPAQAAHPNKKHPAAAEAPAPPGVPAASSLGKFDAWAAYASQDKSGKVCYLVGQPQKSEPAGFARKQPTAMVTHRPVETIVTALGKAKQAVVKGVPQKGPPTTDTYPLAGFAKALAAIDKACGVKR